MGLSLTPKFVLALTAACVLGLEFGAKALTGRPWTPVKVVNQWFGWRLLPNQDVTGPRGINVQINSQGYRDREHERSEAKCVVLLGKSITFGSYVSIDDTWGRQLETLLADEQSGLRVMNFAVAGYRLEQMARVLQTDVSRHRPEYVILPLTADIVWPMLETREADPKRIERMVRRTALYDLATKRVRGFWSADGLWPKGAEPSAAFRRRRGQATQEFERFGDPLSDRELPLWKGAEECIEAMSKRVASWGGQLILVPLAMVGDGFDEAESEQAQRWRRISERNTRVEFVDPRTAFLQGMQPLVAELRERKLNPDVMPYSHWLGLQEVGLNHADESLVLLHSPTHYSARGHRVLAEAVAETIRELDAR